ncbi:unnamed protein product, partial [Prunus brigantina]
MTNLLPRPSWSSYMTSMRGNGVSGGEKERGLPPVGVGRVAEQVGLVGGG